MAPFNRKSLVKKLLYQSKNRGCKEIGLILSKFATIYLPTMDDDSLKNFSLILDQNDIDIYDWITDKAIPPLQLNSKVMLQLLSFDMKDL